MSSSKQPTLKELSSSFWKFLSPSALSGLFFPACISFAYIFFYFVFFYGFSLFVKVCVSVFLYIFLHYGLPPPPHILFCSILDFSIF
ncbi:mCG148071 [Mus musculus]|nr:mCG148071 [Mus musculus]